MARQAKIQISADVQQLKDAVKQAKDSISGLGSVKINNKSLEAIKDVFGKDLERRINSSTKHIQNLEGAIEAFSKQGKSPLDKQFSDAISRVKLLKTELKSLKEVKTQLEKGEIGVGDAAKKVGGGSGGLMKSLGGGAAKVLGALGIAMGVGALYNTGMERARSRSGLKALTGGTTVGPDSTMGYSPEERRNRASTIAGALGRNVSGEELNNLTGFGERLERGYGVGQDVMAGGVKEARRAGIQDSQKFLATSIGIAVSQGLEGSRVGEYLSSMTDFMGELASGITVDTQSINDLSSAFGDIPFFKNDPSRLFSAMRGMDDAFKSGDRFQQAQAARGIMGAAGEGLSPASIEIRRSLGLFGGNKELSEKFGGQGTSLGKSLGVSGSDIVSNIFKEIQQSTSGMNLEEQAYEFMNRTGLKGQAGLEIFDQARKGQTISDKSLKMAQLDPAKQMEMKMNERLASTFEGADKTMLQLDATIKGLQEWLAGEFFSVLSSIFNGMQEVANVFGVDLKKTPQEGTVNSMVKKADGMFDNLADTILSPITGGKSNEELLASARGGKGMSLGPAGSGVLASAMATGSPLDFLASGGPLTSKEMPMVGGDPEALAARMAESGSGLQMPTTFQTTDPEGNTYLRQIVQLMVNQKMGSVRGPAHAFPGGSVGVRK